MSDKFRTVVEFATSSDVEADHSGEAGYEVLCKIDGHDHKIEKIKPGNGVVKLTIEAPKGARVAGLVFPVNSLGLFGQGRPFNFTVKDSHPPRTVGEPIITHVYPPLAVVA